MSNLEHRRLQRAYVRCPRCGRILKVRMKMKEDTSKGRAWAIYKPWAPRKKEEYEWRLEQIPKHKRRKPDPNRLQKLMKGLIPNEHPWCHVMRWDVKMPDQPRHDSDWEFINWR